VAAGHSVDHGAWVADFDALIGRIASRFGRVEPRRRAREFVLGLLAGLPRTNCWTIAEHAGANSPEPLQHLLSRAVWDHDGVRDDLRGYVLEHLGDDDAVLVVDETGDVKKGTTTVGVQRQYTGTAGRIENAQVAVYLTYASTRGHAFIDRALYLPVSWTEDRRRCAAAGIPDDVEFATKPALARAMIARALDAGTPAAWVAGDEVYGTDPQLRRMLHERGVGYVLAVPSTHRVDAGFGPREACALAAPLPEVVWQTYSAGPGAKGHRWYDWALIAVSVPEAHGEHALLVRRHRRTGVLAYYRTYNPRRVSLATLVRVAGRRWAIEESFQACKGLAGLDEHQVRRWTSWHRATILSMLAHAFLAVTAAGERATHTATQLIPMTANEIRHLFTALRRRTVGEMRDLLHWSQWRRRHQARARESHYRRQATAP